MPQVQLFALLLLMLVIPLGVFWLALFEERQRQSREGAVMEDHPLSLDHLG